MNVYLRTSLITALVGLIVEQNRLTEQEAIAAFYHSKLSRKVSDDNILLRQMSPYLLYELWNTERNVGDYRKSPYADSLL
ncbi:MAG: hypothetical protein LBR13_07700 [Dysgonamonadaceae bacterium]|jgi:hypothetical protein|nr:hypothetical protein [Dysgonamonadaceae bacterium]